MEIRKLEVDIIPKQAAEHAIVDTIGETLSWVVGIISEVSQGVRDMVTDDLA